MGTTITYYCDHINCNESIKIRTSNISDAETRNWQISKSHSGHLRTLCPNHKEIKQSINTQTDKDCYEVEVNQNNDYSWRGRPLRTNKFKFRASESIKRSDWK
jgi:hypothetical protein